MQFAMENELLPSNLLVNAVPKYLALKNPVLRPRSLELRRRKSFMPFILEIFAIPSNTPPDRPIRRLTVQYAARPSNSPPDLLTDHPIRRPIVQNAARPSNSPPDSLPDHPTRRPIVQNAARPSNRPPDRPIRRLIRCPTVQYAARPSNSPPGLLPDRPIRRPIVQFAARPSSSAPDHPVRRSIRRPTVQFAPFRLICSPSAQFNDYLGGLFRHGVAKHKAAFEAVCVTLQYAMDLGEPIFDGHDGMRQQQPNRNKRLKEAARAP
jgi:hypothetical protein